MAWAKTTLSQMTKIGLYEASNPVIACGGDADSDKYIREPGNVLYESGEASRKYKTFYTGYLTDKNTDEKIHYAYSEDGKTWTKSTSNPVISDRRAEDPYVVKNGSTYYLFAEDKEAGGNNKIRRWHSTDCETWSDDGQLTGIGDGQSPTVWIEGSTWYMLYERYPANADIALATSNDGLAWTDDASNPVMEKTDTDWVTGDIVPDDIIKKGSTYYMIYHGHDGTTFRTGIATSTNLTDWVDSSESPFEPDESAVDRIPTASIFFDTEDVFLYWARDDVDDDDKGLYRGYPINRPEVKITELPELTTIAGEDLLVAVDDPSGTPITKKITHTNLLLGLISDEAFGSSWDGVTDVAPSKNAIYDKLKDAIFDNFQIGTQTIESNPWNAITVSGSDGYNFTLYDLTNAEPWISCYRNGGIYLYYNGGRTLEVASEGAKLYKYAGEANEMYMIVGPQTLDASDYQGIAISGAANFSLYDIDNSQAMIWAERAGGIKLYYDGSCRLETTATGITVTGSCSGCDYVFEPDYGLLSLDDLQSYVDKHRSLPGMTINKGFKIDLDKFRQQCIEKIEEQALYILQLHERLQAIEKQLKGA